LWAHRRSGSPSALDPSWLEAACSPRPVARLIAQARTCGFRRLILDSHVSMTKAHEIYRAAGFRTASAPGDFPEALKPIAVFMELDLERAGA
jgi:hypothetical protein